ncbi:alpha/beta fold hydrolase [Leuconostoc inhae]|uniref:alpha/beta fold hydrolase n=1 Tax=Leuconostoc inhae TaxID=178001 RepID=UPI001C7D102B|nr:alpha/beta hydrolase [Leuconostoc inhae]
MIDTEYKDIKYTSVGSGTAILFIHGMFLDKTATQDFFEDNSNLSQFRRIYIDLPGMGNSIPLIEVSSDAILKMLISFIDHIIGSNQFIIYGHSYGGYLAQAIAHHYQNQVIGVLITCPVVIANKDKRILEEHKNEFINKPQPEKNDEFLQDFTEMNVIINQTSWLAYQKLILPGLKKANVAFINRLEGERYTLSSERKLTEMGNDTHVYVLLGHHDHVVGYKQQFELFSTNEKSTIALIAHAGHNLMIDQPEIVHFYLNQLIKNTVR